MGFGLGKYLTALAVLTSSTSAADWYAKDVRQGGHDPSMIRTEDGYVLMSTNNMLLMWNSENMVNWKNYGQVLKSVPQWMDGISAKDNNGVMQKVGNLWAPDIFEINGKYGVFYTGSSVFGKNFSAIGVAKNSTMSGSGWTDVGEIVRSTDKNNYNAIDADVVKTTEGEYWMAFGSFWDGIRLIKLDPNTMLQSASDKTVYKIASRGGKGIEGPALIEHNGQYFLFTAWDTCCKQGNEIEQTTYKTAVGRADKVNGTYYDRSGKKLNDGGGTILMERYSRYVGPGGGEPFKDLNRIRFVHHYYDLTGDKYNHIHIRDVVFTDDNWPEMGQPFLGRYLSAEAEHGAMTRSVSGDLTFNYTSDASNGEYVGYINTKGSKIRLPMNIMQAGEYIMRYRYANGGDADATHKVTVNGKSQIVKLPKTGAWGKFPESSVAMIPTTLKRGGNFIEVEPDQNFAELDRIDFLRVIRDTIPANGFDNGIKVRLTNKDQFAIKNGGYAIFENVVTDSIKSTDVKVQLQQCSGGTLSIRDGSKTGTELSKCTIPASCGNGTWTEVSCSATAKLKGVKDFYLTASGNSGEVLVGNIKFGNGAPAVSSSSEKVSSSSIAPVESSSSVENPAVSSGNDEPAVKSSSSVETAAIVSKVAAKLGYSVARRGNSYTVSFDKVGNYNLFVINPMGQIVKRQAVSMQSEVQIDNLSQGNFIFRVVKH